MWDAHTRLSEAVMASGGDGWITARDHGPWLDRVRRRLSQTAGYCWRTLIDELSVGYTEGLYKDNNGESRSLSGEIGAQR